MFELLIAFKETVHSFFSGLLDELEDFGDEYKKEIRKTLWILLSLFICVTFPSCTLSVFVIAIINSILGVVILENISPKYKYLSLFFAGMATFLMLGLDIALVIAIFKYIDFCIFI